MASTIHLHRVEQHDAHMRAISIYVDRIKVGKLESGQDSHVIELNDASHLIQVSITPFYRSKYKYSWYGAQFCDTL